MRIQVFFNETSVLVPCGDGQLTVKELVDKAIVRYKKVLNKHEDDVIEVRSVCMADTHSFVTMDDEVADVLEDKEVVILDFELIPHYIRDVDDAASDMPSEATITSLPNYSSSILGSEDHTPYSSGLRDPMIDPDSLIVPNLKEDFDSTNHQSQELHLDDVDPSATPTSLHLGMGGASQDQTWTSQNSNSQDPNSPHMSRKAEWRTGSDTGYATSKSQESYSQSQSKSQEMFHPSTSDGLAFSSANSGGHTGPESLEFTSTNRTLSGPDHRDYAHRHTSEMDFDRHKDVGVSSASHTPSSELSYLRKEEGGKGAAGIKSMSTSHVDRFGHHDDPSSRFQHHNSQDAFSPSQPHLPPHPTMMGAMEYPPRGFELPYHGYGYGGYPLPSLDESGGGYEKQRYLDSYGKRPMSMYGSPGDSHFHPAYGMMPGRHMMGHYGGRMGYPDFYDPRAGRYVRPHDPLLHPRLNRSYSHERMDSTPPSSLPGSGGAPRSRQHLGLGRPGIEEEGSPMDMFLSQPTAGYFSYEQHPPGFGGMPMMGPSPLFSDHRLGTNPSSGVSLSQPPIMLSHRPKGMPLSEMERMGHYQAVVPGISGESQGRASSTKSMDSLDRRMDPSGNLSVEDNFDLDPGEEEEGETAAKGRNPFQRDFRKSVFRDGSVYSQWMQRMCDYDIQQWPDSNDSEDVPQFEGDGGSMVLSYPKDTPPPTSQSGGEESGEEDDDYGHIHIVELRKNDEPLGIQLTHYTSPEGIDVGVYIAAMDQDGFAARSGKLQVQDRILACNGCDFTKDIPNSRVEEIFSEMVNEPLLKMAISRGGFKGTLQGPRADSEPPTGEGGPASIDGSGTSLGMPVALNEGEENWVESPLAANGSRPVIRTMAPPSAPSQPPSLSVTNTRQIGTRHTIELPRGDRGFGFGLTSRDVKTDEKNQPVYVKTVTNGGSAYQDGRLRIGDRILEVNGVDVAGMSRPDVVQLLRESHDTVTLVVSRQEVMEDEKEEHELGGASSKDGGAVPITVYKTVFDLEIPLHNSGPAGLGVTVYTKSTSLKEGGEIGVYIKSIVAGGAAAMDGRLHKNDQVLSVNQNNLLGYSNQEAMDILKQALSTANTVHLVVARRTTPTSPSMAVVGEEPEEDEGHAEASVSSHEVGIDVPTTTAPPPTTNAPPTAPPTALPTNDSYSRSASSSSGQGNLVGGVAGGSAHNLLSSMSVQSQGSAQQSPSLSAQTSLTDGEPSRGSMRGRATTLASTSPSRGGELKSPRMKALCRSQDLLGSGEIYDRLEPLPPGSTSSIGSSAVSSPPTFSHFSLYSDSSYGSYSKSDRTSLDRADVTSLDMRGMSRQPNHTSNMRSHPPHMSRDPGASAMSRHPISPSDIDYQIISPTGSGSSRENSVPLHHQRNSSYDSRFSYPSDSGGASVTDAPIRGSGRKDRNRPERGSGRSHVNQIANCDSPELLNGYATVPRVSSHHGDVGGAAAAPTNLAEAASLENLRLSDSESNMAFRRDNPGRISITKKTKKNPRQDFAHLRYDNAAPLVEGENKLVRTGSDSFLSEHNNGMQDFMGQSVQIGPNLGMVKSSSLESLHNVMHHTIKRDIVDDGPDLRTRSGRSSFNCPEGPLEEGATERHQVQRGIDVDFELSNGPSSMPAMISFTKSPHTSKTKKKGFFKNVFKKRKKDKPSPENSRKARGLSMEISPASLTTEERDQLMRHYTLQLRPQSHTTTGMSAGASATVSSVPPPTSLSIDPAPTVRHSMPVLDDYDSPGSPDELLLESMAKV